ncbi:hypothetical protein PPERSA_11689 [Pseudocohnilembus persalinus]|uniref:Uncharacterized protein n=1 Tax=Pseudocohnilembus persalinus TaxID=266149 RepID=A0A0V0R103_PSEPJ|nr:hypothetical protein PPERSA_11689 [Pseudocohnilembus persalinus]|eukprot:KRX08212.1 hypothetical protein PPERSA_11689 [Pseudocohnilembus persalinus]
MNKGEMIHCHDFSLFEAMSGSEIGDPKIDIKGNLHLADTVEKMIEKGYLKSDPSELTTREYEDIQQLIEQSLETLKGKVTNAKKKQTKKNVQLNEFDGLQARIQLQRSLLEMQNIMYERVFSLEIKQKLQKLIKNARIQLNECQKTFQHCENMENIKSNTILQTLLCQVPPKKPVERSIEEGYKYIENMFQQIEQIIIISEQSDLFQIENLLDEYQKLPKCLTIKVYLEMIFLNHDYKYFQTHNFLTYIEDELINLGLTKEQIKNEHIQTHVKRLFIVEQDFLTRHFRNSYRQQREFPKIQQDFSIIIHEATTNPAPFIKQNSSDQVLVNQAYTMGIKLMIKQLQMGTAIELYDDADQPQQLFYQDYLYTILQKNQLNYIQKLDKEFIQAYNSKLNLAQKKKKLSDFQRAYFYDYIFGKGILSYVKGMSRIAYILLKKKVLPNYNNEEQYENRFNNRFEKIFSNEQEGLDNIQQQFKDAQEQFNLIPTNDNAIPEYLVQKTQILKKMSVQTALASVLVKMNYNNIEKLKAEFILEEYEYLPILKVSKIQ